MTQQAKIWLGANIQHQVDLYGNHPKADKWYWEPGDYNGILVWSAPCDTMDDAIDAAIEGGYPEPYDDEDACDADHASEPLRLFRE